MADSSGAQALPPGWKELEDTRRGRKYYYHKATRRKTWTRPGDDDADEGPQVSTGAATDTENNSVESGRLPEANAATAGGDDAAVSQAAAHDAEGTDVTGAGTTNDTSAAEWVELTSEDGLTYYFNNKTKASEWSLPAGATLANERGRGLSAASSLGAGSPTPRSGRSSSRRGRRTTKLAGGWVEVWDDASQAVYYFHKPTKRSSWSIPPELVQLQQRGLLVRADSTGSINSVDSETSYQAPPVEGAEGPAGAGSGGASAAAGDDGSLRRRSDTDPGRARSGSSGSAHWKTARQKVKKRLPDPWRRIMDPRSKRMYYYNKLTKKSHWRMPPELAVLLMSTAAAVGDRGRSSSAPDDPRARASSASSMGDVSSAPLPDGWRQLVDKKGRTYYYERATKAVSWTRPTVQRTQSPLAASPDGQTGEATTESLADGWTAIRDPTVRQTYYYHAGTDRSSWTRPTPLHGAGGRALKLAPGGAFEEDGEGEEMGDGDDAGASGAGAGAGAGADAVGASSSKGTATAPDASAAAAAAVTQATGGANLPVDRVTGAGGGTGPNATTANPEAAPSSLGGLADDAGEGVSSNGDEGGVMTPQELEGYEFDSEDEFPSVPTASRSRLHRVFRSMLPGAAVRDVGIFSTSSLLPAAELKPPLMSHPDAQFEG